MRPIKSVIQKHFKKFKTTLFVAVFLSLGLWSFFHASPSSGFLNLTGSTPPADLSQIQRITRSAFYIQNYYYDPSRIDPPKMLKEGLNAVARLVPEMLVEFEGTNKFTISVGDKKTVISHPPVIKLSNIFQPAAEAFKFLSQNIGTTDIKPEDREYAFVNGMLSKLDPHSDLLPPKAFEEFKTQTEGEYGGLGIVVGIKEDELTAIAPLEDTPAMAAGVKPDDKIIQIDDVTTINMPLSDAVDRLRGKIGTHVTLVIRRKNMEPFEIHMTRRKILIQSVKSKLVSRAGKNYGIVRVTGFQEDTYQDMMNAINKMRGKGELTGLILDMRNNPGGLLDQAIRIGDKFLRQGDILYTAGAQKGDEEVVSAEARPEDITFPMVVLVNEGSASASEIVAGALQGNDRAAVIGTKTFGKGSVQTLYTLKDGSSLKLTIAQYLTPGRVSIQAVGIIPDIQLVPMQFTENGFDIREDKTFGEKELDEHLINPEHVKIIPSFFKLPFFQSEENKEEESEYTSQIDETKDHPLNFALTVLEQAGMPDRLKTLEKSLPLLENFKKLEEEEMSAALKEKNIDWVAGSVQTNGNPLPAPTLSYSSLLKIKEGGREVKDFESGQEIVWEIKAKNNGDAEADRVIGVVDSEHPLLKEREFVYGKLAPGESRSASITIKVPKDSFEFEETTTVDFYSDQGAPSPFTVSTRFAENPKPRFAYEYSIIDNGKEGSIGDGDFLPEKGETIVLNLTVKNESPAAAETVSANLKNDEGSGVLLTTGRVNLEKIPAGASKSAKMVFKINSTFAKDAMKLTLSIIDKDTKSRLTDTLILPLKGDKTAAFDPPQATLQEAPRIVITRQEIKPNRKEMIIGGTVTDNKAMGDLMIFAGGDKVYYEAAKQSGMAGMSRSLSLTFEKTIPLKDGANIVSVEARDDRKMTTEERIVVVGAPKKDS